MQALLVVNTALPAATLQCEGLQQLWIRFRGHGLLVIGVPVKRFRRPGTPAARFIWATGERPLDVPRWNFLKYLVRRDGHIAAVFSPEIERSDARIVAAVAREIRPAAG